MARRALVLLLLLGGACNRDQDTGIVQPCLDDVECDGGHTSGIPETTTSEGTGEVEDGSSTTSGETSETTSGETSDETDTGGVPRLTAGCDRYVDAAVAIDGSGASWGDAHRDLVVALAYASPAEVLCVASGVYRAAQQQAKAGFAVSMPLTLLGGFCGTEATIDEPRACETVLSGDVLGNDDQPGGDEVTKLDNAHAVLGIHASDVRVEGFTISGGYNRLSNYLEGGAGVRVVDAERAVIENCIIEGNVSFSRGGGVFIHSSDAASLRHVLVQGNRTIMRAHQPTPGGGIYATDTLRYHATLNLEDVVLTGNQSGGGSTILDVSSNLVADGLVVENSSGVPVSIFSRSMLTLRRVRLQGNTWTSSSAALRVNAPSFALENLLIVGNTTASSSSSAGSAVRIWLDSSGTISHATIAGNVNQSIEDGYVAWSVESHGGDVTVANSILQSQIHHGSGAGSFIVDHSLLLEQDYDDHCESGSNPACVGVIVGDPGFISPPNDYRITAASPAHGAGNPEFAASVDIDGHARNLAAPDLGCHEVQ